MPSSSDTGDQILKHTVAASIAKYSTSGHSLSDAVRRTLEEASGNGWSCAVAAIDAQGNVAIESTARHFPTVSGSSTTSPEFRFHPTTMPILGFQTIYRDDLVSIGLSRYPTTSGHTIDTLERQQDLFSLAKDDFVRLFTVLSRTAGALTKLDAALLSLKATGLCL